MITKIKWENVCFHDRKIIIVVAISNEADNPVFEGIYDFCSMYCGASIGMNQFCHFM